MKFRAIRPGGNPPHKKISIGLVVAPLAFDSPAERRWAMNSSIEKYRRFERKDTT
jgi:hypothetical protein